MHILSVNLGCCRPSLSSEGVFSVHDAIAVTLLGHRWWSHDDLRHTDDWIWPHELVELWSLAGQPDAWPIDLGTQEESTVLDVA